MRLSERIFPPLDDNVDDDDDDDDDDDGSQNSMCRKEGLLDTCLTMMLMMMMMTMMGLKTPYVGRRSCWTPVSPSWPLLEPGQWPRLDT